MEHKEFINEENLPFLNEKQKSTYLDNKEIKDFIRRRAFKEEDFDIIEDLLHINKNVLIKNFHNFFSFAQDNTLKELDSLIRNYGKDEQTEDTIQAIVAAQRYKTIVEKYDWYTANNLNSVLESYK